MLAMEATAGRARSRSRSVWQVAEFWRCDTMSACFVVLGIWGSMVGMNVWVVKIGCSGFEDGEGGWK
ncbi:hypothetical protein BDW42DRAFT_159068 [Aspergillus taichungensis]|uniref:Uncharacterized protein n=1 Tax=Aspergillus taichungensis TaxID=482145 RepID=A0A2J5I8X3_9EURO|nr:hypothetical protein BDW42DRAFT_159068 [Aspergillus taichungensis]